jgi:energy-coupling factor transporter ATP-binding protein EcfA2
MSSSRLSPRGLQIAESARRQKGWQKNNFRFPEGKQLGSATVTRFFKRVRIHDDNFRTICEALEISVDDVVDNTPKVYQGNDQTSSGLHVGIYASNIRIQCSTIKASDGSTLELNDIFTRNNFSDNSIAANSSDLLNYSKNSGVKLIVSGRSGSGKTTLIKYLALEHVQDLSAKVPVFLRLANLSPSSSSVEEFSVEKFLRNRMIRNGVSSDQIDGLLNDDKLLILLDGLDEVSTSRVDEVIRGIGTLVEKYRRNSFIVTTRSSSHRSNSYVFDEFLRLRIAGFQADQIHEYAQRFFQAVNRNSLMSQFESQISSNPGLADLASVPLLLTLLCSLHQENQTLFQQPHLVYRASLRNILKRWISEDSAGYEHHMNALIKVLSVIALWSFWEEHNQIDADRIIDRIQQDQANFLLPRNIAAADFVSTLEHYGLLRRIGEDSGRYAFVNPIFQEYLAAKAIIAGYTDISLENALEHRLFNRRWHGIWEIMTDMLPQGDDSGDLQNADTFVYAMYHRIQLLLAGQTGSQQLLSWVAAKAEEVHIDSPYKPACIRATYLDYPFDYGMSNARETILFAEMPTRMRIDASLGGILFLAMWLANSMINLFEKGQLEGLGLALDRLFDPSYNLAFPFAEIEGITDRDMIIPFCNLLVDATEEAYIEAIRYYSERINSRLNDVVQLVDHDDEFLNSLLDLKSDVETQMHNFEDSRTRELSEIFWRDWHDRFRGVILHYCNIGYDWSTVLTSQEYSDLKDYYNANLILARCIRNVNVSSTTRSYILQHVLLPISYCD